MTWNYRIINHGEWLGLHEVHYSENGEPVAYTAAPAPFSCDTEDGAEGIIASLQMALKDARSREVLPIGVFTAP
jgi:molybdopterin-guanine dinucleotide biosynthesis protein A